MADPRNGMVNAGRQAACLAASAIKTPGTTWCATLASTPPIRKCTPRVRSTTVCGQAVKAGTVDIAAPPDRNAQIFAMLGSLANTERTPLILFSF
jgi:hypothetical protein